MPGLATWSQSTRWHGKSSMVRRPSSASDPSQKQPCSCSTSSCAACWVTTQIAHFGPLMLTKAAERLQQDIFGLSATLRRPLYVTLNSAPDMASVLTSEICWRLLAQQRRSRARCKPVITRREDPHPAKPA